MASTLLRVPPAKTRTTIYSHDYELLLRLLREARRNADVSQIELAKRLRLTQSTISKCERGELRLDAVQLRNWCHAMGVSFPDFTAAFDAQATKPR